MFKKLKEWFLGTPKAVAEAPYKVEAPAAQSDTPAITVGPEVYAYPLTAVDTATLPQAEVAAPAAEKKAKKPAARTAAKPKADKPAKAAKAPAKKAAVKPAKKTTTAKSK